MQAIVSPQQLTYSTLYLKRNLSVHWLLYFDEHRTQYTSPIGEAASSKIDVYLNLIYLIYLNS
jgi:hypothetical protein